MATHLKSNRIHYLDSIRGLAALSVAIYHFIGWKWHDTESYHYAAFLFNGSDAVSFFFVLSGFVLAYPYLHFDREIKYGRYVWKRILRLYPAYIFTILILALYWHKDSLSLETLNNVFIQNKGTRIWNELAMVLNVHKLYIPGWTLRIEMIYSLIIPFLIVVTKWRKSGLILILILSYFIGEPRTRMCMTHFILGITLAIYYPQLIKIDFKTTRFYPYRWFIYFLIFVLYSLRNFREFIPEIRPVMNTLWSYNIRWEHFSGIAAFFILVLVAMNKNVQKSLETKPLIFLGQISYSIYLIHWLLVRIIMDKWDYWGTLFGDGYFRFYIMLAIFLLLTIFFSHLMYKFIEKPFIVLSKKKWN